MSDERHQAGIEGRLKELERRSSALGQPVTVQRRAALKALIRREDHPTAEAICADVVSELPGVSKATVYRALDNLVELGLARRVHHEGSVARYDGNSERHHHLVCDRCGSIADIGWEVLDAVPIPRIPRETFEIHDFFVSFQGLCRDCLNESGSPSQSKSQSQSTSSGRRKK
jgi:Fur family transcriptional regulator, peroxide stress response regulator